MNGFVIGLDASELVMELRGIRIYTEQMLERLKAKSLQVRLLFSLGALRTPKKLYRALKFGIDGVFTGTSALFHRKIDVFHGLRGRLIDIPNIAKVLTIHDLYPLNFRRLTQALRIGFNFIITPSNFVKSEIIQKIPSIRPDMIRVVYMGINHKVFRLRTESECRNQLDRLGLSWKKYWIYVGSTVDRRKNFETMRTAARLANQILFVPRGMSQQELGCAMAGAVGLLFVTLGEGFGLPPIEAMACGVPVIVSKCGAIPEIVGDAGLYVDNPLDPKEIARKMRMLMSSDELKADLISKGLDRAKLFDWDSTVEKTIEVYKDALKQV